jgi:hypothetical protein
MSEGARTRGLGRSASLRRREAQPSLFPVSALFLRDQRQNQTRMGHSCSIRADPLMSLGLRDDTRRPFWVSALAAVYQCQQGRNNRPPELMQVTSMRRSPSQPNPGREPDGE